MSSFLTIFGLIGVTLIVTRSPLFEFLRSRLPGPFSCSQCFGMWVGVLAGGTAVVTTGRGRVLDAIIVGAATSFLSLLANAILENLLKE